MPGGEKIGELPDSMAINCTARNRSLNFDASISAKYRGARFLPVLSMGASKPATKGRNSEAQNQPVIYRVITSNNLSCQ